MSLLHHSNDGDVVLMFRCPDCSKWAYMGPDSTEETSRECTGDVVVNARGDRRWQEHELVRMTPLWMVVRSDADAATRFRLHNPTEESHAPA